MPPASCIIDRACVMIPEGMVVGEVRGRMPPFPTTRRKVSSLVTRDMLREVGYPQGANARYYMYVRDVPAVKTGGLADVIGALPASANCRGALIRTAARFP